jgi:glycosyltransferase involved in cell wall biosynthesis
VAVYIDIQGAQSPHSSTRGIGRYVTELATALEELDGGRHIASYALNDSLPRPLALQRAIAQDRMQSASRLELQRGDVYHVTSPFEPVALAHVWPRPARLSGVRLAVTLYDLIPLVYPEHYLADELYRARYLNRLGLVRQADSVLTISAATARDARERLGLDEGVVSVAGTGVSERFRRPDSAEDAYAVVAARIPGLRRDYVLYTGALDFRKNVDALLVGYGQLPAGLRRRHQLLIVSRSAPHEFEQLRVRLRQLGIEQHVRITSGLSDDDLVPVYQAAGLFVFPSLYEGFGLPVAEAISCGAPTIAARCSSLVEIVPCADALFDPRDPADIGDAMRRALTDPELRGRLAKATLAERHTWPVVARHVLDAYQRIAARGEARSRATRRALSSVVSAEESPWSAGAVAGGRDGRAARFARGVLWPARRFFDPRFGGIDLHIGALHADLGARLERAMQPAEEVTAISVLVRSAVEQIGVDRGVARAERADVLARLEQVREELRELRERVEPDGTSARPPAGRVELDARNDAAVAAIPFALSAMSGLPRGARVLVFEAGPDDLRLALLSASLGHKVTVLAGAGSIAVHPNVRIERAEIAAFENADGFDAAIRLALGEDGALPDAATLRRLCALLHPGGLLVLAFPEAAPPSTTPASLRGFAEMERRYAVRLHEGSWVIAENDSLDRGIERVVLMRARRE